MPYWWVPKLYYLFLLLESGKNYVTEINPYLIQTKLESTFLEILRHSWVWGAHFLRIQKRISLTNN